MFKLLEKAFSLVGRIPVLYWPLILLERLVKQVIFRCSMCGQCVLSYTGFTCPLRCAKQLRNGPCGGSSGGRCEIDRKRLCTWDLAYRRAKRFGLAHRLERIQPPVDWTLKDTSSWVNHFTGRDRAPWPFSPGEGQED